MNLTIVRKKTRNSSILDTIFKTSATNFIVMLLTTLTSIVTARMFGVEGRGEFSAIIFWSAFLTGLVSFGLPTSLIYNLKNHEGHPADYIRLCFLVQIPVSIIVGIIVWIFLPNWMSGYSSEVIDTTRWYTVLSIPMLLAIGVISALTQSINKFYIYNGLRLNVPLFNLIGLVALWLLGHLDIHMAAVSYLLTSLLVVLWSLFKLRDELRINWLQKVANRMIAKSLFQYGSRVFGVELVGNLYNQFDKLIILSLLSAKELGLYTVVYALSRIFNVVQSAITSVVFPKVTGLGKEEIYTMVTKAFRISFIAMLIIVTPSMFVGRFFLGLLFGEQFLEASATFYILCFECIIGGSSWILASAFNAMGKPGLVLIRQLVALSITISLFFVFTPIFGLNGIALALLVGGVIRMLFSIVSIVILFKVPFYRVIYNKSDIEFILKKLKERTVRSSR